MHKSKIFLYGGCDLFDIVKNDFLQRDFDVIDYAVDFRSIDNNSLDFSKRSFPGSGTSIISLYTKPGMVAQRILETLSTLSKKDRLIYSAVYNEIVKFPYLQFYKKYVGPDDYLLISFSSELYTKFIKSSECFSIVPPMGNIINSKSSLHWLYKECLTKDEYLLPFDTKESLEWSFDLMVDFARDIYNIFNNRVILVKTHFSNFAITNDHKVKKVTVGPDDLLFYKQTKIVSDSTDHKYAERLSTIIMNKFRHHYNCNLDLIELDDTIFLDAGHSWGVSQFHIDINSRNKIAKLIHENISKKIEKKELSWTL